jgi:hypothetical protein
MRRMKPDLYTKAVLTVIAFMLVMMSCRQYISPSTTVQAEGKFADLQFAGPSEVSFFDTRTGEVWIYHPESGKLLLSWKVTKLGSPLTK